ncbi:hypothetical protein RYX36_011711 [Vicia faba]
MTWQYVILTLLHGVHITLLFRSLVLDQEKSKFVTGSTRKIMRGLLLHEENKSLLPSYLYDLKLGANAFPVYDRHMRSLVLDQEKSKFVTGSTRKIMRGLLLHEDTWFWTRKNRSLSLVLRERSCVDCCYMKILGFGPGKIEVCHWFYEKDHAWTVAT